MIGKLFITSSGYDPELGKLVKDPYLGPRPTFGACRPDIRKQLTVGDHIFVISGKIKGANQFVLGGLEIRSKIDARDAFRLFPEQRLRLAPDGQVTGNIIIDESGQQHPLDHHKTVETRLPNYIVGTNAIQIAAPDEIERGRRETMEALQEILQKAGSSPIKLVGRWGCTLTDKQVWQLREWLQSLKKAA
jgi:hypothetical protein